MEKLEGKVTISKNSSGKVYLSVEDNNSGIKFVEVELSMKDFADAMFGLAFRPCKYITRGLDKLGKQYISEEYIFEIEGYGNKEAARKIAQTLSEQDPTWDYSTYFGSQGSFFSKDGKQFAKTTRFKYI